MAGFPNTPSNGQTAVVNGITYTYNSARTAWIRSAATTRNLYTASNIAPTTPGLGDQWYYIASDILFEYMSDGTSSYWVDITSLGQVGNISNITDSTLAGNVVVGVDGRYSIGAATGYVKNVYANTVVANTATIGTVTTANGNVILTGNIIPSSNVAYNLGSTTNRFKDLWLSGSTIYLGGASLSTDGANVTISNPQGGSFSVAGTSSGSANVSFGNIFGNYYFSNGAAFTSSSFGNTEVSAYLKSINGLGASTDAIILPVGTTAQRATVANGAMRYNSSINGGSIEAYLGGTWVTIASGNYGVGFIAVAGGGGGAGRIGSGGGAGGAIVANVGAYLVTPSTTYTIVVGAGGTAGPGAGYSGPAPGPSVGGSGSNSSAFGFVAYGGGGGGSTDGYAGLSGGSGGGGGRPAPGGAGGSATQTSQGIAVGYGNPGGAGANGADRSGGGGGAGATGSTGGAGGHGGTGILNPVPGSSAGQNVGGSYYLAGGGGGTGYGAGAGGNGGNGGGGAGINSPGTTGSSGGNPGTTNTGGGGGGGGYNGEPGYAGGAGGSGIVIVYYVSTTQRATGGSVTSYSSAGNTYWIHTYTSTGTLSFIA